MEFREITRLGRKLYYFHKITQWKMIQLKVEANDPSVSIPKFIPGPTGFTITGTYYILTATP